MKFPDLSISSEEIEMQKRVEGKLVQQLQRLFRERYDTNPDIRCKGSTEKGTALPERFFGIDFDASVLANDGLLQRISYKSNTFEGCQLFGMPFLRNFMDFFEGVYFAGHRISGKIEGKDFDFSITDEKKDKWKWDYNASKYLQLSQEQLAEIRKTKFFLKTHNVYGSEVYGVVGPAVELLGYQGLTFEELLERFSDFKGLDENFANAFATIPFPKEFYNLFMKSPDSIHEGLVASFRYTTPNSFNRLIEAAKFGGVDIRDFVERHKPVFNHMQELNTQSNRLAAYVLGTVLKPHPYFHVDHLVCGDIIKVYASASDGERAQLDRAGSLVDTLTTKREFEVDAVPSEIKNDIASKFPEASRYRFFIGHPDFPLIKGKTYIPFDFLVRADYKKLATVMEGGQNDSC